MSHVICIITYVLQGPLFRNELLHRLCTCDLVLKQNVVWIPCTVITVCGESSAFRDAPKYCILCLRLHIETCVYDCVLHPVSTIAYCILCLRLHIESCVYDCILHPVSTIAYCILCLRLHIESCVYDCIMNPVSTIAYWILCLRLHIASYVYDCILNPVYMIAYWILCLRLFKRNTIIISLIPTSRDENMSSLVNRMAMHKDILHLTKNISCWRMKDHLDVTWYFISLLMCSACFGH